MRSNFDRQLAILHNRLIQMATYVESAVDSAVTALITGDARKAEKAIDYEADTGRMERDIEALCLRILLLQQPVAKDLRTVSAALKMITDMGRIADQARDISEIFLKAPAKMKIDADSGISNMATATIKMVHDAVDAFIKTDLDLAQRVVKYDDVIDSLYVKTREELIEKIRANAEDVTLQAELLSVAKYFEKMGDHAHNIAQWVIFSITGKHEEDK